MEKVLTMAKTKSKSVIIDGEIHSKFKVFCKGKNLKLGMVIQDLVSLYINKYKEVQKMIDENKEY